MEAASRLFFTSDSSKFEARKCSCPRLCVREQQRARPAREGREVREKAGERFRSRVEVSWCHGNTRRDRERLWPPFPLAAHCRVRMRTYRRARGGACTRLTAASSKGRESAAPIDLPSLISFLDTRARSSYRQNGSICHGAYIGKTIRRTERNYTGHRAHDFLLKATLPPRRVSLLYIDSWPI